MAKAPHWNKGRGKLGPLAPLIGAWSTETETPMGLAACARNFSRFGEGWILLEASWRFGSGPSARIYRETAFLGPTAEGPLGIWSFTNDGKRSEGVLSAAPDVHSLAICFEADMPAGRARQIYWPDEGGGLAWAVEAKNARGWKRFSEHHYTRTG
jgi:hypothetical protein